MKDHSESRLEVHGGKPLHGNVRISGAKNEVTKLMVASILLDSPLSLTNVPAIGDVERTIDLVKSLGVRVAYQPHNHTLKLDARSIKHHEALFASGPANRLSILLAGPLLYRFGQATLQKPGGCQIGERPLDLHLSYLRQLGITIEETDDTIHLKGKLRAATIEFPYKSVGATEGALLSAIYAEGETIIKNPAIEPEIVATMKVLQQAGALFEFDSQGAIHVTGVTKPLSLDHPVAIIGDRVEAISYASAALATGGDVVLEGIEQEHIMTALTYLRRIGASIEADGTDIRIRRIAETLHPVNIETDPHPAFATDFQQVFAVLLSQSKGTSYLHETVFDNRFAYVAELNKLGGSYSLSRDCAPFTACRFSGMHNHTATIHGVTQFHGGSATITDLRAAFGLVMAGLLGNTPTHLDGLHHLMRGYDNPVEKLQALGAQIGFVPR